MARVKTSKGSHPRSLWEDETVADNANAPARAKELNGLKWKRRALTFVAFAAVPAMFVMGAGMMAQANAPAREDTSASSVAVNGSKGKAEAFRALNAWLAKSPSPLPGGTVVSWDGYTTELPPAPTNDSEVKRHYAFETHTFTLARGSAMFHAYVQIVADDVLGASATSEPSLEPIAAVEVSAADPWFTLQSTAASAQVRQAVDAWAAAFTGGDADALHQIVQDRNTDRSYIPLRGVDKLVGAEITAAGAKPLPDGKGIASDTIVVRVSLSFWWKNGKPAVADNEPEPVPTPVTYDLLVEHADTATPVVVAWGGPGDGPKLVAYQNAVATLVTDPKSSLEESGPVPTPSNTPATGTDGGDR